MADEPDGICWVIFDAQVEDIPRWRTSIRSNVPPVEAPTLEALVGKLGLPPATLETVAAFNRACPPAAGAFKPFEPDRRATRGLAIEKSHWSRPISARRSAPTRSSPPTASPSAG